MSCSSIKDNFKVHVVCKLCGFLFVINKYKVKRFCSEDLSLIENYDKAVADKTQTWHCHHRRETIYTREGLIEIGEYYNRPAYELIFLTKAEHNAIHNKLRPGTMKGKKHSEESKKKMSIARKGKTWSEEQKLRRKGKHWYNNGITCVIAKECPEGFVLGRIMCN